jgi:hypothetical protein
MAHDSNGLEAASEQTLWIHAAVSMSYRLGLHQYPTNSTLWPSGASRVTWMRLWWSCYVLDRSTAIDACRNPHIRDDSWDVPMISVEDLRANQSKSKEALWPTLLLAQLFVEKAKLCVGWKPAFSISKSFTHRASAPLPEHDFETELIDYLYTWKNSRGRSGLNSIPVDSLYIEETEEVDLIKYISDRASGDLGWNSGWNLSDIS